MSERGSGDADREGEKRDGAHDALVAEGSALLEEMLRGDDAYVSEDLICVRCGYNLKGQARVGRCPECETPVRASYPGLMLGKSAPWWVADVRSGLTTVLCGLVMGFALLLLELVYRELMVGGYARVPGGGRYLSRQAETLGPLIRIPGLVMMVFGVWRFTRPDPALGLRKDRLRKWLRAIGATTMVVFAAEALSMRYYVFRNLFYAFGLLIYPVLGTCSVVLFFEYARRVVLRIPDVRLANHLRQAMAALFPIWCVCVSLLFVRWHHHVCQPGHRAAAFFEANPMMYGCAGVAVLLLGYLVWVLIEFRQKLVEAAEGAEATWERREKEKR